MEPSEEDDKELHLEFFIPLVILNVVMLVISLLFFILLIKSKAFNNFQCYNIIIFSLVILLDCVVRIIPFSDDDKENYNAWEYLQAFLLTFFDKVILAIITTQTILFYLGVIHTKTFFNNDKLVFLISFVINVVVSLTLTILYLYFGNAKLVRHRRYIYCGNSTLKEIADPIFNSAYLIPNLYCSLILIIYLIRKLKEVKNGLTEDADYMHHFKRTIILTLLNMITFLESFFIIFDVLKGEKTDIIYLSTLLAISIFNCGNKTVIKETMKIFCKNKYKKVYGNDINGDDENNDDDITKARTYSL